MSCPLLVAMCSGGYTNSPLSHAHGFLCQNAAAVVLLKVSYYCYKNDLFWFLQTGTSAGSSSNFFKFLCDIFKLIFNVKNVYLNSLSLDLICIFKLLKSYHTSILYYMCTFFFFQVRFFKK